MSKAYDTVHIPTLAKAIKRICLPKKFISIITFLFTNRINQVITDYGLTNKYNVRDRIDQGETILPILWRIFYDPLISRVNTEYRGYKIIPKHSNETQNTNIS